MWQMSCSEAFWQRGGAEWKIGVIFTITETIPCTTSESLWQMRVHHWGQHHLPPLTKCSSQWLLIRHTLQPSVRAVIVKNMDVARALLLLISGVIYFLSYAHEPLIPRMSKYQLSSNTFWMRPNQKDCHCYGTCSGLGGHTRCKKLPRWSIIFPKCVLTIMGNF